MHMRRQGVKRTKDKFYVGEEEIAIVEEYNYLGCIVDEHKRCRTCDWDSLDFADVWCWCSLNMHFIFPEGCEW